jgi:hypothetical protein
MKETILVRFSIQLLTILVLYMKADHYLSKQNTRLNVISSGLNGLIISAKSKTRFPHRHSEGIELHIDSISTTCRRFIKKKRKKEGIFILILPKIIHILLYMLTLLIDTVKTTNFIYCYVVLCFVPVGSVHVRDCLKINFASKHSSYVYFKTG